MHEKLAAISKVMAECNKNADIARDNAAVEKAKTVSAVGGVGASRYRAEAETWDVCADFMGDKFREMSDRIKAEEEVSA